MSELSKEILNQINNVKKLPYELNIRGHQGASEDITWDGKLLLEGGPTTNCVCFVTEVVVRAMKTLGLEKNVPFNIMQAFQEHSFIIDEEKHFWGMPEAVDIYKFGDIIEIEAANVSSLKGGDVAQFWMMNEEDETEGGHAVIVLSGQNGEDNEGKPYIVDYNASNLKPKGHFKTWHNFEFKRESGYERVWCFARLDENKILTTYR